MLSNSIVVLVGLVSIAAVFGCAGSSTAGPQPSGSEEATLARVKSEVINGDAIMLDVREEDEWNEGHLQHARLAPLSKLNDDSQRANVMEGINESMMIYTHCKKGGRAKLCADLLQKQGYRVVPLEVAYEKLIDAGFPADKSK